jgi:hypothetical protein
MTDNSFLYISLCNALVCTIVGIVELTKETVSGFRNMVYNWQKSYLLTHLAQITSVITNYCINVVLTSCNSFLYVEAINPMT